MLVSPVELFLAGDAPVFDVTPASLAFRLRAFGVLFFFAGATAAGVAAALLPVEAAAAVDAAALVGVDALSAFSDVSAVLLMLAVENAASKSLGDAIIPPVSAILHRDY